jgi:hypothetical protein
MPLFLVYFFRSRRFYWQYRTGQESQLLYEYVRVDDNYMEFLMVASQKQHDRGRWRQSCGVLVVLF